MFFASNILFATAEVPNQKNTNGFFPAGDKWFDEGSATTVFRDEPVKSDSPDVGFYQERDESELLDEEQSPQLQNISANQSQDPSKAAPFDTRKATPDQLMKFYGNPEEDPVIPAEEKAPVPFKAMMAAMDSGNDELAYKYARQYVRYMRNMSERVERTAQFQELAVEREGIRPGMLKENPYTKLLEDDLAKEETKEKFEISGIDPRAQKLINAAQMQEDSENPIQFSDPKGEIDAYLFFMLGDAKSISNAKIFQTVANKFSNNPKINFQAFSRQPYPKEDINAFMNKTGLNVKVSDGGTKVIALGITDTSSIVLVARNSKQILKISAEEASEAEIINLIKMGSLRSVRE
jgi:hypothetical protein